MENEKEIPRSSGCSGIVYINQFLPCKGRGSKSLGFCVWCKLDGRYRWQSENYPDQYAWYP